MKVLKKNDDFYEICLKDDIKINCEMKVSIAIVYSQPNDDCKYLSFEERSSEYNLNNKILKTHIEPNYIYAICIEYGEGEHSSYKYRSYIFIKISEEDVMTINVMKMNSLNNISIEF